MEHLSAIHGHDGEEIEDSPKNRDKEQFPQEFTDARLKRNLGVDDQGDQSKDDLNSGTSEGGEEAFLPGEPCPRENCDSTHAVEDDFRIANAEFSSSESVTQLMDENRKEARQHEEEHLN